MAFTDWVFTDELRADAQRVLDEGEDTLGALPGLHPECVSCTVASDVEQAQEPTPDCAHYERATVARVETLTAPEAPREVHCLTLLCAADGAVLQSVRAGDALAVRCANSPDVVAYLLDRLGLDPQKAVLFSATDAHTPPDCLAARLVSVGSILPAALFSEHMDVAAFPKKALLRALAEYTHSPVERAALLLLSSRRGSAHYMRLANWHATLADFLAAFPSCSPPLATLVCHVGVLHPRHYSACRIRRAAGEVDVVFSATRFAAGPHGETRTGVCSSFLERICGEVLTASESRRVHLPHLEVESAPSAVIGRALPTLLVCIRSPPPPPLRLPADRGTPVIMVCAGTGIAPFIGLLDDERAQPAESRRLIWLVYGFRRHDWDYLFRQELEAFVADGTLARLVPVASRERPPEARYVQHVLEGDLAADVWALWTRPERPAAVVLCGDNLGMVREVNGALVRLIERFGGQSGREAASTLATWTAQGRVIRDVWV